MVNRVSSSFPKDGHSATQIELKVICQVDLKYIVHKPVLLQSNSHPSANMNTALSREVNQQGQTNSTLPSFVFNNSFEFTIAIQSQQNKNKIHSHGTICSKPPYWYHENIAGNITTRIS